MVIAGDLLARNETLARRQWHLTPLKWDNLSASDWHAFCRAAEGVIVSVDFHHLPKFRGQDAGGTGEGRSWACWWTSCGKATQVQEPASPCVAAGWVLAYGGWLSRCLRVGVGVRGWWCRVGWLRRVADFVEGV